MIPASHNDRPSALILAAGLSSRMGRFKPLLPLGEVSVVERVINCFRTVGVDDICVAVGHRAEDLRPKLRTAGVAIAENPRFREGMFSSIQAGLAQIDPRSHGVFILPVDIPLVRPATLQLLMEACAQRHNPGTTIHPVFDGQRGHPPLIPADLITAIRNHNGVGGLRAILEAPTARAVEVQVPDRFILQDMDHPERYKAMKQALIDHDIPTDAECEVLLGATWEVADCIKRHSRMVAAAADAIAAALCQRGAHLNTGLIHAGALLHDIAKGEGGHAQAGAKRLRQLHFDRVADIVAHHDDIALTSGEEVGEAEVVFIADKHISKTQILPMEARFAHALKRFGDIPSARRNILRRQGAARAIRDTIEARLQAPLAGLITRATQNCDGKAEADKPS